MIRRGLVTLAAAAVLSACGPAPATSPGGGAPPLEVHAATARSAEVADTLEVVGSLEAHERVVVSSEVGGIVAEVRVDFGDRVAAGEVLLHLDAREPTLRADAARAAVAQADAVLARARANHQRAAALYEQQILSKELYDGAVSELRVAQANREAAVKQLALAQKQVDDTVIRSPLSGFVVSRRATAGQYVGPYTPVMELVAIDPVRLRIDVPERAVGALRAGLPVRVELDAFPGEQFEGTVTRIGSALDAATRTLPIESAIPNPEARLKPGQFARAQIDLGIQRAVVVPRAAVDTFAGTQRAFVIRADGRVEARTITTGRDLGQEVVILDGVHAGEAVAVSHLERLAEGVQVQAVRPETS